MFFAKIYSHDKYLITTFTPFFKYFCETLHYRPITNPVNIFREMCQNLVFIIAYFQFFVHFRQQISPTCAALSQTFAFNPFRYYKAWKLKTLIFKPMLSLGFMPFFLNQWLRRSKICRLTFLIKVISWFRAKREPPSIQCLLMQAVCGGGEGAVHSAPEHSGSHAARRLALTLRQVGACPHLAISVFPIC